ncbi:MAG: glycosyltransferase family 39 protein, partial [Candidatus Taylorbacteria bacterium]|nr:glycosyltransferase family 39 protein [Candidatus Taylorbacteria bacterium]
VSRLTQLEALLFFCILLNIFFFLKLLDHKKWWWVFGISFGTCLLIKYTCVFLVPVYFVYLLVIRSNLLKDWRWYAGWGIAGILFLPVIIYNIKLYGLMGHFDLQFAYLFGQQTPEWHGTGGKNQFPFSQILSSLGILYSIPLVTLAVAGLVSSVVQKQLGKIRWFMVLVIASTLLLLTAVGSAVRFISLLAIPITFFATLALFEARKLIKNALIGTVVILLFVCYEGYFTSPYVSSHTADYGIRTLDNMFNELFKNARTAALPVHPNPNLNNVIENYSAKYEPTLPAIGLVYDDRISTPARLWVFARRQYYHGIPIMPASTFLAKLEKDNAEQLRGFQIYFVKAGPATTISDITDAHYNESLETFFSKVPPESQYEIKTKVGDSAFKVATFTL